MKNLDCNCLLVKEQAPIDLDNRLEGIALTFEQGLERTKPYTIGLVVGGFAAPSSGSMRDGLLPRRPARRRPRHPEWMRSRAFARVPQGEWQPPAAQAWPPSRGYDNRAKRDERVAVIMTDIQVPADILDKVSTSCSRSLS